MNDIIITKRALKGFLLGALCAILLLAGTGYGIAVFYAGGQDVVINGGTIVNLNMTLNDTDAAHKLYVDKRGPYYEGITTVTTNGSGGGLDGMNAKCNGQYPGSHLCTHAEILSSGVTSLSATSGWIACNVWFGNANTDTLAVCFGSTHSADIDPGVGTTHRSACNTFTTGTSSYLGAIMGGVGTISAGSCATNYSLHCCS